MSEIRMDIMSKIMPVLFMIIMIYIIIVMYLTGPIFIITYIIMIIVIVVVGTLYNREVAKNERSTNS